MSFKNINAVEAKKLMNEQETLIIDIRDPQSFFEAHIPEAINLTNQNIQAFLETSDKHKPVICYCYHGISSQNAAAFLKDKGFQTVYSLEGGFEAWKELQFP